jgi:hypothetical protein
VSIGSYWDEYNKTSDSSKERHREPKHNRGRTARTRKENRARSASAPLSDEEENFIQETPEVALVAAQAHLLTTQPEPGDPREHMHQAAEKSLGLVGDELKHKSLEKKSVHYEHKGKEKPKIQNSAKPKSQFTPAMKITKHEWRTQGTL